MPDTSAVLGLPYLMPSQAQKHVTHNEAVRLLDILVQLRVMTFGATTPPVGPAEGEIHALGNTPTGAWAGQALALAVWLDGVWRFLTPQVGWRAADATSGVLRLWDGADWVLPASSPTRLSRLGINADADTTNRLTVASEAVLFNHDGAGHQVKINKAAAGDTASLLFQSGWSGHAEMGLAGSTDFAIKVSSDGSAWHEALMVDAGSGVAALPAGITLGGGTALLDTYARGTWTPEIADAASGGATGSATTALGRYTRVGDLVSLSFALDGIDTTGLSGSADLFLRALPWPARNHGTSQFTGAVQIGDVTFSQSPFLCLEPDADAARLMQNVSGGSPAYLAVSAFSSGTASLRGSLIYRV